MKKEAYIVKTTLSQNKAYDDWLKRIKNTMDSEVKTYGQPFFTIRFLEFDTISNTIIDHAFPNIVFGGDVKTNTRNFMLQYPKQLISGRILIASSLTFTAAHEFENNSLLVVQIIETALITKKNCFTIEGYDIGLPFENRRLNLIPGLDIMMPMKNHPLHEDFFPIYNISKSKN